jgi:signal transduction histidine kinase
MMNLVEDILDLSRFEFNKFELNNSWFSIIDLIEEAF